MKKIVPILKAFTLSLLFSVLVAALVATQFSGLVAIPTEILFAVPFGIVFLAAFVIPTINLFRGRTTYGRGILAAGLYPEVYTAEIIKRFNSADAATWRVGIPNKSQYASMTNDGESVVINMTYFGVSPDVLVDNNTYPIDIQALDGENLPISLKKLQTKATPITDDEIRGLSYDKIRVVQEAHAIKIMEEKNNLGIHSIAPAANTSGTLVLVTTGANDGTGRLRLTRADVLSLKANWDKLKIPVAGRRLVLCPDHINDLLAEDQKFQEQYYNFVSGKVGNMYGFEIYEYPTMPNYHITNKTKLAYGAVPTASHNPASVAFHILRVAQASGFTKAYLSLSSNDPLNQRNLLNYRHYDIVLPVKNEAIAAIVSGKV